MSFDDTLYPRIAKSIAQSGAEYPEFLAKNFARILQRIELLWGEKEVIDYFDSLFLDNISDNKKNQSDNSTRTRQGFPVEAVKEIVLLKQVHQLLFPSTSLNPFDPFSGSEIVPIEIPANTDAHSENILSRATNVDTAADRIFPEHAGKKHLIEWPIIRTQHELVDMAKLQQKGENIYPLQGKPVGEILIHYGVIDGHTLHTLRAMQKRPDTKIKL